MINISLFFLVILPVLSGFLLFAFKSDKAKMSLTQSVFLLSLAASLWLFSKPQFLWGERIFGEYILTLGLDRLSRLILIAANLFGFLVCLFSQDYIGKKKGYFSLLLWLLAFSNLEILATDFVMFIFAWGAVIVLLYSFLGYGSDSSAKKAMTIVGFSYLLFILGAGIYIFLTGVTEMPVVTPIPIDRPLCWLAFFLMVSGALAKAGCGPFHTWIPAASESAPVPVMAILPASLDKLLGIYIFFRICTDFFTMNYPIIVVLLMVGSLTIIFAVMMALIQHDLRKLLSYHAISQAGYMVLGIATVTSIGTIGAIYHMFNNAIYKSGLFLVTGSTDKQKDTFEVDKLGGLARYMPLTFAAALIFSLSISGIPPFNGFASKWMIYQGALEGLGRSQNFIVRLAFIFAVISAMFGSALTLASFVKFIHAGFLGQDNSSGDAQKPRESSWKMVLPLLVLALLCVGLGVFSDQFVKNILWPSFELRLECPGSWASGLVSLLLLSALAAGVFLWGLLGQKKVRQDVLFTGGETAYAKPSFPATEFYKTIEDVPAAKLAYRFIKIEKLDMYNIINSVSGGISRFLYGLVTLRWIFRRRS